MPKYAFGWLLDGDGSGADARPSCCVRNIVEGLCEFVVLIEDIEARLLVLWNIDPVGDVGAD